MNKQSTAITNIEKQSGGLNIDDDSEVNNHDNTIQTDKHRMIVVSSLGLYFAILLMATITCMIISNQDLCSMITFLLFTSIIALICYADSHCCSKGWPNHNNNITVSDDDDQTKNLIPESVLIRPM
ncbi:hypothetical protein DERP_006684 [Dermatophagoides pteronyssinus]|uniref:Uncharacterized protein n=1 Tax=Dermatophagoides pteronyssinus TaxID=6956 RepID=A0ABQ8IQX2_DERPT|nr:hypothetical protein DERP_006684 [Dermatophagoides pteronyssinus]